MRFSTNQDNTINATVSTKKVYDPDTKKLKSIPAVILKEGICNYLSFLLPTDKETNLPLGAKVKVNLISDFSKGYETTLAVLNLN